MQKRPPIGVRINDYRADVRTGLLLASRQAFTAVEIGTEHGEIAPDQLSQSGRRHLARTVANGGLVLAAVARESRGGGLFDPARVDEEVARAIQAVRMAADVGAPIFSHAVGALADVADDRKSNVLSALRTISAEAERVGAIYAVRAGLIAPDKLSGLLAEAQEPWLQIAIDPGALLMAGYDPAGALAAGSERVALAYVRDATRGKAAHPGIETALGEGGLDLHAYLAGLNGRGYHLAPILRRATCTDPASALAADRAVLAAYLPH